MIKVEGLTKRYGRNVAVDNISFEVQKGQIVGFLGPNGAGKTTTMRVLTCFCRPPRHGGGGGYDVLAAPMEVKRRIGYLPETPPLYPRWRSSNTWCSWAGSKGSRRPTWPDGWTRSSSAAPSATCAPS